VDPHNNVVVIVAKLFVDMLHLRVCAGSMPKFRPSLDSAGSSGALRWSSVPTLGFGRCDGDHEMLDCD
jgi:hypothetical protein